VRALHLTDRVELLGARSSDDVLDIVRSADIAVLPSVVADDGQMEGVPVALMEALACEIPVVAPRLSGIPELVIDGNNGLLVEPGDPVALAEALEVLASDPDLRRRLGRAGRTHVLASFDARENARMLVACFSR
jgi:glycosyltransferase involved in cell wall biosynthesis